MSEIERSDQRRGLPAVSRVLAEPRVRTLSELYGSETVTICVRSTLQDLRELLSSGALVGVGEETLDEIVLSVEQHLEQRLGRRLSRMLNATGVFLHTNLGRAPLPLGVAEALPRLLDAYCDLEIERQTGNLAAAKAHYEKALKLDPDDRMAKFRLNQMKED